MNNKCKIIEDLWPLYVDDELHNQTKAFVEEHVKNCPNCHCLTKEQDDLNYEELLKTPAHETGAPEKFLNKLKRKIYIITAVTVATMVLMSGITWQLGKENSQASFSQKQAAKQEFYQKQISVLREVSPDSRTLFNKWGVSYSSNVQSQNKSYPFTFQYSLNWDQESPVEWVNQDTSVFADTLIVDASSGEPLHYSGGIQGSSGRHGLQKEMEVELSSHQVDTILLRTEPFYAFLTEPDQFNIPFRYDGGEQNIQINKILNYKGVKFRINNLKLTDGSFKVTYEQLTPVNEVGFFQLSFAFDDRLGNVYSNTHDVKLDLRKERVFSMDSLYSPSKNWMLHLKHVIQVIPGVRNNINVQEVNGNE